MREEMRSDESKKKKLSRGDVVKSFLIWLFFSHSCYNYERMQGVGFAHAMVPILTKLYDTKEDISAGLKRHLTFFNTEPNVGAVVHGLTIAMEEEKANGAPISDEAINATKTGLMGPFAGIGDTITQGTITPILLAFGISLGQTGNILGPILYAILISVVIIGIAYGMWMTGYNQGRKGVESLVSGNLISTLVTFAGILGSAVMGALTAQFVSVSTPVVITVGVTSLKLQTDILDKILPGILPLALTLIVWWLLSRKHSAMAVMGYILLAGIILGLVGFL